MSNNLNLEIVNNPIPVQFIENIIINNSCGNSS